jgi:hypothetical protein
VLAGTLASCQPGSKTRCLGDVRAIEARVVVSWSPYFVRGTSTGIGKKSWNKLKFLLAQPAQPVYSLLKMNGQQDLFSDSFRYLSREEIDGLDRDGWHEYLNACERHEIDCRRQGERLRGER